MVRSAARAQSSDRRLLLFAIPYGTVWHMTIRNRTEMKRAAGIVGVIGLGGAAGLHGLWAAGSSWPAADKDDLADLVVGRARFPSAGPTAVVAGMLATAAALTAAQSGLIPVPSPSANRVVHLGMRTVAAVLLTRGLGGLGVSALGLGGASERFRYWDLRVYSPLCVALGGAVAVCAVSR